MKRISKLLVAASLLMSSSPALLAETTFLTAAPYIPGQGTSGGEAYQHLNSAKDIVHFYPPMATISGSNWEKMLKQSRETQQQTTFSKAASSVAPPVQGCYDVDLGPIYSAPLAPSGSLMCFQFIAPEATKIQAYVANLPANEQHNVNLVQVNDDGSLVYLDSYPGTSPNKIVEAIPGGPVRLLLLVESQQGVGSSEFLFQILGITGYDRYEPNDSPIHPTALSGNQVISANLDTAADIDYYNITASPTQSNNRITFAGIGTQTAELFTNSGWASLASGSTYTVSAPGGATLSLRVRNTSASAAALETYTLRISDGGGHGVFYQMLDEENITHLVYGRENVARTVTVGVNAYDSTNNVQLPPGEHITVVVGDVNLDGSLASLTTASGYTNSFGNLLLPLNIGTCKGDNTFTGDFVSPIYGALKITYTLARAYAIIDTQQDYPSYSQHQFWHICKEDFLSRY
jgi:hypothetical protein